MKKLRAALLLFAGVVRSAAAHNGPPFPIIVDKPVGPCIISLWTHPDIGIGTFWVLVDAPAGRKIPKDLGVELVIQPTSGRISEVHYTAKRDDSNAQLQYKVEAPFDRQEMIRVKVITRSGVESGEAVATVEVTPVGFGRWDLLLYLLPFLGVGFLWFRAMTRKRERARADR